MNILFIVSSYEKGKDGVGDYVRLLQTECERLGHLCAVLAINDKYINNIDSSDDIIETSMVLRLPEYLATKKKMELGQKFVKDFKPDWVSIQMVSYGFHPRGFVFGLGKMVKAIIPNATKIQVMFHELWIGMAKEAGWKERVYGYFQKKSILGFIKKLNPDILHVGNDVYYSALAHQNIKSSYLPVFSNIPIEPNPVFDWIYKQLAISPSERTDYVVLLFFGTIHPAWNVDVVLTKVLNCLPNRKIVFVSAGSQGYGASIWEHAKTSFSNKALFIKLGFLDEKQLSELLKFSDIGFCTTPCSLLGKSGTAMAMLEHGLPIIIVREELHYRFSTVQVEQHYPNVFDWTELNESVFFVKNKSDMGGSKQAAKMFLSDLLSRK